MAVRAAEGSSASFLSLPTRETVHQVSLYIMMIAAVGAAIAATAYYQGFAKSATLAKAGAGTAAATAAMYAATFAKTVEIKDETQEERGSLSPKNVLWNDFLHRLQNRRAGDPLILFVNSLVPALKAEFEEYFPDISAKLDPQGLQSWFERYTPDASSEGKTPEIQFKIHDDGLLVLKTDSLRAFQNELYLLHFKAYFVVNFLKLASGAELVSEQLTDALKAVQTVLEPYIIRTTALTGEQHHVALSEAQKAATGGYAVREMSTLKKPERSQLDPLISKFRKELGIKKGAQAAVAAFDTTRKQFSIYKQSLAE